MRLLRSLIYTSAAALAVAVSEEDTIILLGSSRSRQFFESTPPALSPTGARLVLAKHLGLDEYHSLQEYDDETFGALNYQTSRWQTLLEEPEKNYQRTLIYIDGLVATKDFLEEATPSFTISDPPGSDSSKRLVEDFLVQGGHTHDSAPACSFDSWNVPYLSGGLVGGGTLPTCGAPTRSNLPAIENLRNALKGITKIGNPSLRPYVPNSRESLAVIHISMEKLIKVFHNEPRMDKEVYAEASDALFHLIESVDDYTAVVIVPSPHFAKPSRTTFGTYDIPSLLTRRQLREEEPLSNLPKAVSSSASKSTSPASAPLPLNNTTPVKTTLPVCHSSNKTCFAATNGCSSHGSCTLLYTTHKSANGSKNDECWACACKPTVVKNNNGIQTTRWGGPACQKKDISSNFFLLAGISIALVGMATWGVGLMYSIGEEELPSVIGAGVAGPRAQK